MIKTAVFGYGNVGKCTVEACLSANDIDLVGIVDHSFADQFVSGVPVAKKMEDLPKFELAILALPSRIVPDTAEKLLEKGIYTADSFDIHTSIIDVRKRLDKAAKKAGVAAITASGWDPGTDSVIRTLLEAMAPKGITYTNFGPGMSMGHSVAAKAIDGVKDALSITIPTGTGVHRRMVYVEIEKGHNLTEISTKIKSDDYFSHDETIVIQVKNVNDFIDMGHGVNIERKGVSGITHNQIMSFDMKVNNPALTGQILVSAARAAFRQQPGCYTLIEVPPVDFLDESRESAVKRLV